MRDKHQVRISTVDSGAQSQNAFHAIRVGYIRDKHQVRISRVVTTRSCFVVVSLYKLFTSNLITYVKIFTNTCKRIHRCCFQIMMAFWNSYFQLFNYVHFCIDMFAYYKIHGAIMLYRVIHHLTKIPYRLYLIPTGTTTRGHVRLRIKSFQFFQPNTTVCVWNNLQSSFQTWILSDRL